VINRSQHLIKTGELAKEFHVSAATLCRWTSDASSAGAKWRSCMVRRGWYSIPKLRAAGLLSEFIPEQTNQGVCDVG
jgi:hypothetical protein